MIPLCWGIDSSGGLGEYCMVREGESKVGEQSLIREVFLGGESANIDGHRISTWSGSEGFS